MLESKKSKKVFFTGHSVYIYIYVLCWEYRRFKNQLIITLNLINREIKAVLVLNNRVLNGSHEGWLLLWKLKLMILCKPDNSLVNRAIIDFFVHVYKYKSRRSVQSGGLNSEIDLGWYTMVAYISQLSSTSWPLLYKWFLWMMQEVSKYSTLGILVENQFYSFNIN